MPWWWNWETRQIQNLVPEMECGFEPHPGYQKEEETTMTRLDQIEYRLNYLLSQYDIRKDEPGFKIQIAFLAAERKALLKQHTPLEDVE